MVKTILDIDGMMCGMCESHMNDAIRNAFEVEKVTSSHTKGTTEIISKEPLSREALTEAVEKMGYKNNQTRCFVDEIETDPQSRGNGFATKMLTSFLPSLCSLSYISSIVLQAGAFDVENEKQTQTCQLISSCQSKPFSPQRQSHTS